MNKKTLIIILLISTLILTASCSVHYRYNSDFVLIEDILSPDGMFQIVKYHFDIGALGYSRVFWAVIPTQNININMENYLLPDGYKGIGWTKQNELLVERWKPYYSIEHEVNLKTGDLFMGVKLIVSDEIPPFIKAP